MKTIVITGASGSGKTYLSNKLSKLFSNSILINTDSYYRDNIFIQLLSIFKFDIYDRPISIKINEINKTIKSIYNREQFVLISNYDFKKKKSTQSKIKINYNGGNQFLILEGIFSHRLDLNYKKTINIVCKEKKEICFKRRLKRDKSERGRNSREVNIKFIKSWNLFNTNIKHFLKCNNVITLNPVNKKCFDKLVCNLNTKKN